HGARERALGIRDLLAQLVEARPLWGCRAPGGERHAAERQKDTPHGSSCRDLVRVVLEADAPVRAVAERLVLRGAAAAQRVALARGESVRCLTCERDIADNRIRSVLRHGDSRRALRRL